MSNFKQFPGKGRSNNANNKRSNGKGNFKRSNGKVPGKFDSSESNTKAVSNGAVSSLNDRSWYNHNPELLEAAGRIPFAYVPGRPIGLSTRVTDGVEVTEYERFPGVMAIDYVPTIGWSDDVNSPASIAAREMYAKVRAKFSGTLVADAPDLMMYVLSLDSVFSYIAFLRRLYRTLNSYTPYNTYYPNSVIQAMGVGNVGAINNLREDKTRLWGLINTLIANARKFRCPGKYDLLARHYWMNNNIYADAPHQKAQMYMFVPMVFYTFDETGENGGHLVPQDFATALYDATNKDVYTHGEVSDFLFNFGWNMIEALSNSEDAYTINGYFDRAYEGESQFTISDQLEDEVIAMVYEPEVLMQIENARTAVSDKIMNDVSVFTISQDPATNAIIQTPKHIGFTGTDFVGKYHGLNMRMDHPTPSDVAVATRLACVPDLSYVSSNTYNINYYCGTELVVDYRFFWFEDDGSLGEEVLLTYTSVSSTSMADKYVKRFALMSTMDWHPILLYMSDDYGTRVFGDIDNIGVITDDDLINLHRTCVYSQFDTFSK